MISFFFYGIIFLIKIHLTNSKSCTFVPPCKCQTEDYTFDLNDFMQSIHATVLIAKDMEKNYTFYLHPCEISPTNCKNDKVTGCQIEDNSLHRIYGIAHKNGNSINGYPGNFNITNSFQEINSVARTSNLVVLCSDEDYDYRFIKEDPSNTYTFILKTKYGCPKGGGGLSVGSVLVIIFFVLLIIYIVGGVLFMKFVRKAEGVEVIPNVEFWKDFPLLVKDGTVFVCRGCKAETTYEKI